ncbi:MAG: XdhC family protein [Acidimicrobiales bacterium]
MRDVLGEIDRWRGEGARLALARVVGVEGSGPRDPGATMVVADDGRVAGSVSGGCVEGAVFTEATAALADGVTRLATFGYSDDEAFAVGLTCGGTLRVLVQPSLPEVYEGLAAALRAERPVTLATVVSVAPQVDPDGPGGDFLRYEPDHPDALGSGPGAEPGACMLVRPDGSCEGTLGDPGLDRVVGRDGQGALQSGGSGLRHYGRQGQARGREVEVFVEAFAPPPRMLIFGAVDFTAALAKVAKVLGYHITVCDARPVFATAERFPMADEVVVDWPHRHLEAVGAGLTGRDAVCVLTHDPKFDVPAIRAALGTGVGYIGAMGSRRTHADRTRRLVEAGVDQAELGRVMGPIGLDIGARTPEETAISICGEIIARRTGRPVDSLRDREGPVHLTSATRSP